MTGTGQAGGVPSGGAGGAGEPLGVGVMISGRGSNMEALASACATRRFPATIRVVVSNRPGAPGLETAREMGLATRVIDQREFDGRASFEDAVDGALREHGAELVCLAGFMRVLSSDLVSRWPHRILNIHPSLLPAFPGLHAQQQALEYGVRYSGCTVHFVIPEVDAGPVVLQAVVPVEPDDDAVSLSARILEEEHRIYPEAVRLFAAGRLRVEGRHVHILPEDGGDRRHG